MKRWKKIIRKKIIEMKIVEMKIVGKKIGVGFLFFLLAVLSGCSKEIPKEPQQETAYGDKFLAETMEAPEHYTFQKESESGISKVLVNADVIVPGVYGADVLEAIPAVFTDEEIQAFIDRHNDDSPWINQETGAPYAGEGLGKEALEGNLSGFQSYRLLLHSGLENKQDDALIQELLVTFWAEEKTGEIAYEPALSYFKTKKNVDPSMSELLPLNENDLANDCTIPLKQAIALGNEEVSFFFTDFSLSQYGQLSQSGIQQRPSYYGLKYTRTINGIPVNLDIFRGVGDGSDYTIGNESISITVNDDGVCWLYYRNPLKTGEVVEQNVTLLPFADIIDIFEKVSMLSIQHLEVYENLVENVMDIREIRFGYMAVKQSEHIGGYRYIPVWDFYGIYYPVYENNQYYPEAYDDPVFTINAIDGTVIDRDMGY